MSGPPQITTGGHERIHRTALLYKDAMRDDPVITYMLANLSTPARYEYMYDYYTALMTAAGLNAGIFEEALDFSACLVLVPPGRRVDNPWTLIPAGLFGVLWNLGVGGCWRMLLEYEPLVEAVKTKILGQRDLKEYYYVFHVATEAAARGKGLATALIRSTQARARAEGLPVWLEATTEKSWKLYGRLGFETVGTVVLGNGVAAPDGSKLRGGEGVPVWCMLWVSGV